MKSQILTVSAALALVLPLAASEKPKDNTIGDSHLSFERSSMESTVVKWIDRRKLHSELLTGTFLDLGLATAVEIAADLGFDWLRIDLEHGSGTFADLRSMLLACRGSSACSIIRVPSANAVTVKFVMDSYSDG